MPELRSAQTNTSLLPSASGLSRETSNDDCGCEADGFALHHCPSIARIDELAYQAARIDDVHAETAKRILKNVLEDADCDAFLVSELLDAVDAFRRACIDLRRATDEVDVARRAVDPVRAQAADKEETVSATQNQLKRHRTEPGGAASELVYEAEIELARAKAELDDAKADVDRAKTDVERAKADVERAKVDIYHATKNLDRLATKVEKWSESERKRLDAFFDAAIEGDAESRTCSAVGSNAEPCVICGASCIPTQILRSAPHAQAMGFDVSKFCNVLPLCGEGNLTSHRAEFEANVRGFLCLEPDNPDRQNRKWVSFTITGEVSTPLKIPSGPHCGPLHERAKKVMKSLLPHHQASIFEKLKATLNKHHHNRPTNLEQRTYVLEWFEKKTSPRRRTVAEDNAGGSTPV